MQHKPVLLSEVLEYLAIKDAGVYLDCTFGRGGHSRAILAKLGLTGRLLALDRDQEATVSPMARELLKDGRFKIRHARFSDLESIALEEGIKGKMDGILLDLGVSSPQLDDPKRGFSFMHNGPLDMRMDSTAKLTAADWLAEVDETSLAKALYEYGEERFAKRVAKAIVASRSDKPIATTHQLVELIKHALPFYEHSKHPATRAFQALRIAVNQEFEELDAALRQSLGVLKKGGRLVVISFHSLEDRMVKRFIRDESGAKFDPGRLPVKQSDIVPGSLKKIAGPIKPSLEEIHENPRARSAVMRVAERV